MAVLATSNSITLSTVVDINGYYRYYLLQSSTAAVPAKPTAYPPTGGWTDTEPTYTSGSTNSLYIVDCTEFNDGTWEYSDVSLSSSYEAAKAAYNRAVAAGDAASAAQATADSKADPMTATAHGSDIAVSDSAEAAIGGLVIYGRSEQGGQTTGKNLLPYEAGNVSTTGGLLRTIRPDGGVHISGTTTGTTGFSCHFTTTGVLNIPAGTYRFILTGSGTGYDNVTVQLYTDTGAGMASRNYGKDFTYTITSAVVADYARVRCAAGTYDCVVYPMMILSSETDTTFEPYTGGMPTPNPRFPSLIHSAGMTTGKNLLVFKRGEVTGNGVNFSPQPDGSLHIWGTASATTQYNPHTDYTILNLPHGMYRFYLTGSGTNVGEVKMQLYVDNNDGNGLVVASGWQNTDWVYTVRDSAIADAVRIRVSAGTYDCVVYPMVLPAYTDDTSFEGYTNGPVGTQITLTCADDAQGTNATHTTLPTPNGLPGIAVSSGGNYTDENGQQWICDTIDLATGTYTKRCEMITFDGSSGWSTSTAMSTGITGKTRYIYNGAPYLRPAANTERAIAMCDQYPVIRIQGADDGILTAHTGIGLSAAGTISVYDSQYGEDDTTGFTAWKAMLAARPMHCLFALATPVVTPLTEAQLTALRSIRTRDGTTVLTNDAGADMDLTYATQTGGGSYVEGVRQGLDEIFKMWYSFTDEGMIVQKKREDGTSASIWSTVTDNIGFHIRREDLLDYVFSAYRDRCKITKLEIGDLMIKPSGSGGMVWVKK